MADLDRIYVDRYRESEDPISIRERTDTVFIGISADEKAQLSAKNEVQVRIDGEDFIVTVPRHVGVISLPGGLSIEVKPKVSSNLLHYLAFTGRIDAIPLHGFEAGFSVGDSFVNLLGELFLQELRSVLRGGVFEDYLEHTATESVIRGRLDITRQIQSQGPLFTQFACTYDRLTTDLLLNRLVLTGAETVGSLVSDRVLRTDLEHVCDEFRSYLPPDTTKVATPRIHLSRMNVTQLTQHYARLLKLLELVFADSSFGQYRPTGNIVSDVLINTETLFEQVVFRGFEAAVGRNPYHVHGDADPDGQADETVGTLLTSASGAEIQGLQPDVFLRDIETAETILIADAKWRDPDANRPGRSALYQMAAYQSAECVPGLLVYPALEGRLADEYRYNSGHQSLLKVIELNVPTNTGYDEFCNVVTTLCRDALDELLHAAH